MHIFVIIMILFFGLSFILYLKDKTSMRLLGLEFKSDTTIYSQAIKYIVKKYCSIMSRVV